jgi:drug/metabolite transporter (DMT)-like permease
VDAPKHPSREALLLLLAPAIWGFGFVGTQRTLADMGPLWSNALRFGAAVLLLYPIARGRLKAVSRRQIGHGLTLGALLFFAFTLQTTGLLTTTVSHSSFLTGLYAVFTPILGVAFGRRLRASHLGAAALALVGLWLLARPPQGDGFAMSRGDLLTLGCAVVTAGQILVADRVAGQTDSLALNFWQLVGVAALSLVAAAVFEGRPVIHWTIGLVVAQLYLIVFSSLIAFTIQLHAQRTLPPTAAAMIFLLEAPFGALAGFLLSGDRLTAIQGVGAGLMLAACGAAVLSGEPAPPPQAVTTR